jgi:hypothetical protein
MTRYEKVIDSRVFQMRDKMRRISFIIEAAQKCVGKQKNELETLKLNICTENNVHKARKQHYDLYVKNKNELIAIRNEDRELAKELDENKLMQEEIDAQIEKVGREVELFKRHQQLIVENLKKPLFDLIESQNEQYDDGVLHKLKQTIQLDELDDQITELIRLAEQKHGGDANQMDIAQQNAEKSQAEYEQFHEFLKEFEKFNTLKNDLEFDVICQESEMRKSEELSIDLEELERAEELNALNAKQIQLESEILAMKKEEENLIKRDEAYRAEFERIKLSLKEEEQAWSNNLHQVQIESDKLKQQVNQKYDSLTHLKEDIEKSEEKDKQVEQMFELTLQSFELNVQNAVNLFQTTAEMEKSREQLEQEVERYQIESETLESDKEDRQTFTDDLEADLREMNELANHVQSYKQQFQDELQGIKSLLEDFMMFDPSRASSLVSLLDNCKL